MKIIEVEKHLILTKYLISFILINKSFSENMPYFMSALNLVVLQDIKKSYENVQFEREIYWICPTLFTTVFMLIQIILKYTLSFDYFYWEKVCLLVIRMMYYQTYLPVLLCIALLVVNHNYSKKMWFRPPVLLNARKKPRRLKKTQLITKGMCYDLWSCFLLKNPFSYFSIVVCMVLNTRWMIL